MSEVKGTIYFLAPEAIYDPKRNKFGSSYYSGRLYDVWTVGLTIYSMTFNELPYKPASKGQSDITQAILSFELMFEKNQKQPNEYQTNDDKECTESVFSYSNGKREISEGLKFFLCKMLEKDPSKRASMEQLKKDVWLNSNL